MLRLLSGRTHQVITGVCLLTPPARTKPKPSEDIRSETTLVTMNTLSDDDIRDYVSTAEPMDKAGSYGIQGMASRWVSRIEGDYFNVVGLPVSLVYKILRERGVLLPKRRVRAAAFLAATVFGLAAALGQAARGGTLPKHHRPSIRDSEMWPGVRL
jgi:septum formation protein